MAQIDCLPKLKNDSSEDIDGCTPSKKLKQARLPFKTIDQKAQIISPKSNSASKKRKLSDAESPSAKAPRTPKSSNNVPDKTSITSNETEVSSSSEADNVKTRVRNTLERFVRKSSQEEITSSTNTECIDLTDSEEKESESSFVDMNTCQSKNITEFFSVKEKSKTGDIEAEAKNEIEIVTVSSNATSSENDIQTETSVDNKENVEVPVENKENIEVPVENKENIEVPMETTTVDTNTSSSGAVDPVTPGKGNLQSAVMNTPVSSKKSPQTMETPLSQSPGDSLSDGTPNTGKKSKPKISEAKRKERDALKQKKQEERQKALEEKKRQKEEERLEKEREKEKQRLEREAIKAEKERQKKEEKDKKEKERLEKLQQKEEEQKKKKEEMEAKMEEKRKKEEEKKLKEEEKQKENEEKIKKEQKVKQAFQSFFIKSNTSPTSKSTKEQSGLFMPFQVKKDTKLAPEYRQKISNEQKETLDSGMNNQNCSDLYLTELKKGKKTGKSGKTFPKVFADDDVELLVHDSEVVKKVTYKCKLLQFHMNYRPPYYGTWTKKPMNVGPRKPFKTDTDLLDYEYDSDDDWEEEEPGESLSDCEEEDEKDDECKDEEGDDWMVPHGYLSEDEGVEDDDEITPEVLKMRRDAKAEQWESELKRQTKPVLPQIIGCFWEQATHTLQEEINKQLEQYKGVLLVPGPVPTSYCEPVKPVKGENGDTENSQDNTKVNSQRKPVPEEAMPDLIRLVHGNLMGIKKLIHEFRLYWNSKTMEESVSSNVADVSMDVESEVKTADTSINQEPVNVPKSQNTENDAMEINCAISKRQLEMKITSIATREKRADFKKICWYVNDDILKHYNCEGLPVPSAWESLSQPAKTPAKPKTEEAPATTPGRKTPVPSITQFARPMSPSTIAAQHAAAQAKILAAQAEKKKELEAAEQEKKEAEKMEVSEPSQETVTPQKEIKKGADDQRKLTDFTNKIVSPNPNLKRRIVPTKIVDANSQVKSLKPVNQVAAKVVNAEGANDIKPIEKIVIQPNSVAPVNGMIDSTGQNSRDAILID